MFQYGGDGMSVVFAAVFNESNQNAGACHPVQVILKP
jgi:hypothetical protein